MAAVALTAGAQATKPATTTAAHPAAHTATHAATAAKLPAGIPPVAALPKNLFTISLRYQDIKLGTGAEAQPGQVYRVHYTGWLASNGHKFDSSYDHPPMAKRDKDGNPVHDANGKLVMDDPQPIAFPQGYGRVIAGWDLGFQGMKVGGKRRIFIPWQLAYGMKGRPGPDAANPGIPAKADLIFDIELVGVEDMGSMPAGHGGMMGGHGGMGSTSGMPAGYPQVGTTPTGGTPANVPPSFNVKPNAPSAPQK